MSTFPRWEGWPAAGITPSRTGAQEAKEVAACRRMCPERDAQKRRVKPAETPWTVALSRNAPE